MKPANKVALITGAGSGQGKAVAMLFANEGAAIAAVDIDEGAARQTAAEIAGLEGRSIALRADVSQDQDCAAMVAATLERFGQIDVLYNNAGIEGDIKADALSVENFDHVLAVNLRGAFLAMHYTIPHMVKRRSGVVINVSSIAAITAIPGPPGYAVSKAGLIALTRTTGVMYARDNIRINCILPGPVDTPFYQRTTGAAATASGQMFVASPLGRPARPEEIAKVALFLASDDATFAAARPFMIDGGWTTGSFS